jgi:hypothetical protein
MSVRAKELHLVTRVQKNILVAFIQKEKSRQKRDFHLSKTQKFP